MPTTIVKGEIVEEQIVTCGRCGQKNRLYKRGRLGIYRCGSCRGTLANPFPYRAKPNSTAFSGCCWAAIAFIVIIGLLVLFGASNQPSTVSRIAPDKYAATNTSTSTSNPTTSGQTTALQHNPDGTYSLPASGLTEEARLAIVTLKQKGLPVNADSVAAEVARIKANAQPILPTPPNGETFFYSTEERVAPFEIKSNRGSNYLVKLTDAYTGQPVLTVFIRGGETVNVDVPLGMFVVKYASGEAWYGYGHLFGDKTSYSKASKYFTFNRTTNKVQGYTITLYAVRNGNLQTERIKADEF